MTKSRKEKTWAISHLMCTLYSVLCSAYILLQIISIALNQNVEKAVNDEMTTQFQFIIIFIIRYKWWGSTLNAYASKWKLKNIVFCAMLFLSLSFHSFYRIKTFITEMFTMHLECWWWIKVWMAKKKRSGTVFIEYSWFMVDWSRKPLKLLLV